MAIRIESNFDPDDLAAAVTRGAEEALAETMAEEARENGVTDVSEIDLHVSGDEGTIDRERVLRLVQEKLARD